MQTQTRLKPVGGVPSKGPSSKVVTLHDSRVSADVGTPRRSQ